MKILNIQEIKDGKKKTQQKGMEGASMKCSCHSYNADSGSEAEVALPVPDFMKVMYPASKNSICIDKCIVPVISYLWKHQIYTLSSCCGHNGISPDFPNPHIVVGDGYNEKEIGEILRLISEVDSRTWDIFQWRLIKVS